MTNWRRGYETAPVSRELAPPSCSMSLGHKCWRNAVIGKMWSSGRSCWDGYRGVRIRPEYWVCLSIPYPFVSSCRIAVFNKRYRKLISNSASYWHMSRRHWQLPSVAVGFLFPCPCLTACSISVTVQMMTSRICHPPGKVSRPSVAKSAVIILCRWMWTPSMTVLR